LREHIDCNGERQQDSEERSHKEPRAGWPLECTSVAWLSCYGTTRNAVTCFSAPCVASMA
jgi:hypothetical protein